SMTRSEPNERETSCSASSAAIRRSPAGGRRRSPSAAAAFPHACPMGRSLPDGGMLGAVRLLTIVMSKRNSLPRPHCPPTSGVLVTLGTGPFAQLIGPTTVSRFVVRMAVTIALLSSTDVVRLSTSTATSNRAWVKPSGCVHCFFVSFVYAAPRSPALAPVSEDLNGCRGVHHTSVDMPSPRLPSASTERGNSSALPTEAIFGLNPCWAACFQNVVQSGGMGTPVTISTFSFLKAEICAEKSSVRFGYRPGSTSL